MNFYYGLLDEASNYWGFIEESDPKVTEDMIFVDESSFIDLLQGQARGQQICCWDGQVILADPGLYYVDEQGWHKRSFEEFTHEQAKQLIQQVINTLYDIKAQKAYNGVIINDLLVFQTNQTAITNTVASLALMDEDSTTNWKFYTVEGAPYIQALTKTQLSYIAKFAQDMINECFTVEGAYINELQQAPVDKVIDKEWLDNFINQAQETMNKVQNNLTIKFDK